MKRNVIRNFFVVVLVIIEIISIFLVYKSGSNRETILDNVKLNEIDKYNNFALMIEQDGEYIESKTFPTSGYVLNETLSGCVDNNGNTLENALTYTNGIINLRTRTNAMCYLYFDEEEIYAAQYLIENVDSNVLWDSTLEDDGYRYVGTNPDNYVCFGYDDVENDCDFTSTINTDLYAYRIIGIFEDSPGEQHLKLIKKEALNTTYVWHSGTGDIDWETSELNVGINGSYFLTNPVYSYMQDTNWVDKIVEWEYTATNANNKISYSSTAVDYSYLHEMNRSGKIVSGGEWKTVNEKIGLMYASDYTLAIGSSGLKLNTLSNYAKFKEGWMHINNNDSGSMYKIEWTMTESRYSSGMYYAFYINSNGKIEDASLNYGIMIRPVFYLTSDVSISGEGTTTNPYIITN